MFHHIKRKHHTLVCLSTAANVIQRPLTLLSELEVSRNSPWWTSN